jgi:hypothetical protein
VIWETDFCRRGAEGTEFSTTDENGKFIRELLELSQVESLGGIFAAIGEISPPPEFARSCFESPFSVMLLPD